jgi:hypothetical protein
MGRNMAWLMMAVIAITGAAWGRNQVGMPNAANAAPAAADPVWNPSLDQMMGWVTAGMEAAAAEMYLPDVAGVSKWTWEGDTAAGNGQRLEWAVLLTPQCVGTITGYEAAWHEDLWQRVEAGEKQVVALELAIAVLKEWGAGQVRVVLGMTGSGDPQTAAWLRMWQSTSGVSTITTGRPEERQGLPTAHWAALYYLGQVGMGDAKGVEVMIAPQQAFWDQNREPGWPSGDQFVDTIGQPEAPANVLRVYAGGPDEWAFVEWPL